MPPTSNSRSGNRSRSAEGDRSSPQKRLEWRDHLTTAAVGAASGTAINVLSSEYKYRAVAATLAVAVFVAAPGWIHSLPREAPLHRLATRTLLGAALVAAAMSAATVRQTTGTWTGYAALVAAALTAMATLVAVNWKGISIRLLPVGLVGLGTLASGVGANFWTDGDMDDGWLAVGSGLACLGLGFIVVMAHRARASRGDMSFLGTLEGWELVLAYAGVALLIDMSVLIDAVRTLVAVVLLIFAALNVTALEAVRRSIGSRASSWLNSCLLVGGGGVVSGSGFVALNYALWPALAAIGVGVGAIMAAGAMLIRRSNLIAPAVLCASAGMVGLGSSFLAKQQLLAGMTLICLGLGGFDADAVRPRLKTALRRVHNDFARLTGAP